MLSFFVDTGVFRTCSYEDCLNKCHHFYIFIITWSVLFFLTICLFICYFMVTFHPNLITLYVVVLLEFLPYGFFWSVFSSVCILKQIFFFPFLLDVTVLCLSVYVVLSVSNWPFPVLPLKSPYITRCRSTPHT